MLFSGIDGLADSSHTQWICPRALEKATVAPDGIAHAVLCGSVEFCQGEVSKVTVAATVPETDPYLRTQRQWDCLASKGPKDRRPLPVPPRLPVGVGGAFP